MQNPNRRRFLGTLAAGAALAGGAGLATRALAAPQAVVVGGGPAGAAAALALRDMRPDASVLLIERDPRRLGRSAGAFDRPAAGPDLAALRRAGVQVVLDDVVGLDWRAARLELFSGRRLAFDDLVLAPGTAPLDEPIPGLDAVARHRWPAAWGSAREGQRLAAQLSALPEKAHVVLRLPAPLSHPEAALDRALRLAAYLNRTRPAARLTVLEAGATPGLADRFRAVATPGMTWLTGPEGGAVLSVDARAGTLETGAGRLRADVVNFVGLQGAGVIARVAGLADASGWCPVDAAGRSLHRPETLILGDARKGAIRQVAAALASARDAACA